MSFKVAIIGRPNVGKSTLFNKLVGRRLAIVDDTPGVTRDRREHEARLHGLDFTVIDTAGLETGVITSLPGRMRMQTQIAVEEADILLFVFDTRSGITAADEEFANSLRGCNKPIILVGNKSESRFATTNLYEGWRLGLGEPVLISAEHGLGLVDLRDALLNVMNNISKQNTNSVAENTVSASDTTSVNIDDGERILDAADNHHSDLNKPLHVAIVGRPNVGKSTLINNIIGEDRLLTGCEAGLTRDSISVDWTWRGRKIKLFDTAGLRRKAKVDKKLEKLSVADTLRAIKFAEVVVIILDSTMPLDKQDMQIIDLVIREGRVPIVAFNKWDLIEEPNLLLSDLYERLERLLPQVKGIRAVPISGVQGKNISKLMENIFLSYKVWNERISTGKLNRWLEKVTAAHPPPAVSGRRLKVKYITQVKSRPPSFVLSCSRPEAMPQSYVRYLMNRLGEDFNILGVPIRISLHSSINPYAHKARKT
ncbi:ribosome biogenesis GTPase Der [Bartonella sp. DGB1]|uniref:ribosome biogenesis GTPase Der n=1 Tax=Bartonella sp. DGB1 TaxID=3239807 RepID=UPI0035254631